MDKEIKLQSDAGLIEKIISGQSELYELIIRRYNSYLYRIGRSYGYNHHDTEDLMQDTYISAFYSLNKFGQRSSFKTWLVKIMLNHCYHKRKKFSHQKETVTDNLNDHSIPMFNSQNPDPDTSLIRKELGSVLENALLNIPEDYRMVFSLRELTGLNTAETADALEITESNVKVRLNRARNLLRNELVKLYSADEIFEFNLVHCDKIVEAVMDKLRKNQD